VTRVPPGPGRRSSGSAAAASPGASDHHLTGYVLVALAAVSWGAQSVVVKQVLAAGLDTRALVSARTWLGAACFLAGPALLAPHLLRIGWSEAARLAVLGILGMALSSYTYYRTLVLIPVAAAALLLYVAPIFVLLADVLLRGQKPARRDVAAAVVTLAGAALVVRAYEPAALHVSGLGVALGLFNALAFAFYNLWAKTLPASLTPWTVLAYSFVAGALFWLPLAPPSQLLLTPHAPAVWLRLGVVLVFGTVVPFSLYLAGLTRISAAHASLTCTIEPVVAGLMAYAVLGETLAALQLAGGALVLGGIALLRRDRRPG
jgi:drug/metabolite transporter (DMT)-like permease